MSSDDAITSFQHLVVPGQVIAVSSSSKDDNVESSFLRGHGTYLEQHCNDNNNEQRLVASVTGIVHRVNKLIRVEPVASSLYEGHVGDLVVGRIASIGTNRWNVMLSGGSHTSRQAALPLSGVHLPGGVQRVRTAQDARDMRLYLEEGDLVSAEVHKVQNDGTLLLHTRSFRYGKLENGCLVTVPPALVPRRKNHYTTLLNNQFDVLWGCNGMIWMQRRMETDSTADGGMMAGGGQELAELQEKRRHEHAAMPYSVEERQNLARLRNAVQCLRMTYSQLTPEPVEKVYKKSIEMKLAPAEMLLPDNVLRLTEFCRRSL